MPEITIGALFPLSGPFSSDVGPGCVEAVEYAARHYAPAGWKVNVAVGDPSSVEAAGAEAERLIAREGAAVLVGSLRSDLALVESEVAERLGAVFWAVTGVAADEITSRGLRRTFRLSAGASNCYSPAAVDFVADVLAPGWGVDPAALRIAILVEDGAFPRSFGRGVADLARQRRMPVVEEIVVADAVADLRSEIDRLAEARADVLVSAGFRNVVPSVWRALIDRRPRLRAVIGISGFAFPRDPAFRTTGYDRAFTLGGPYLFSADRNGLPPASRDMLEQWWASSSTPPAQDLALDRDLTLGGMYALLAHVLPRLSSPTADAILAVAQAVDIPMGGTPNGYGVRFDATGDNTRTYALVMQWQGGKRVTVHPDRFALTQPDLRPPFA